MEAGAILLPAWAEMTPDLSPYLPWESIGKTWKVKVSLGFFVSKVKSGVMEEPRNLKSDSWLPPKMK